MELTQQQQERVQQIMDEMDCPLDFKCYKSDFTDLCKVRCSGDIVECLEENAKLCRLAMAFGFGFYCRCPLNHYIQNELNLTKSRI